MQESCILGNVGSSVLRLNHNMDRSQAISASAILFEMSSVYLICLLILNNWSTPVNLNPRLGCESHTETHYTITKALVKIAITIRVTGKENGKRAQIHHALYLITYQQNAST